MATNNEILGQFLLEGGTDFQQLTPAETQTLISQTAQNLFDPTVGVEEFNRFTGLLGRIFASFTNNHVWNDVFARLFKGAARYGTTAQEFAVNWPRAKAFSLEDNNLFETQYPDIKQAFYTINVDKRYDWSVSRQDIQQGFLSETGVNDLIVGVVNSCINRANHDEYLSILQLLTEYEKEGQGFYKVHADPIIDQASAQAFLVDLQENNEMLTFPASTYNKAGFPTFNNPGDTILLIKPREKAVIGVYALAAAFNVQYTDIDNTIITVDRFHDPDAVAYQLDRNIFQLWNVWNKETETFYNSKNRTLNGYVFVRQILAMSPFANAIKYTTETVAPLDTVTMTAANFVAVLTNAAGASVTDIEKGVEYQIVTDLEGTVTPATPGVEVKPDSYTYTYDIDSATYTNGLDDGLRIDKTGKLKLLMKSKLVAGDTITLHVTSNYENPDGPTPALATVDIVLTVL